MPNRPSHIGRDQVDHLDDCRGEAHDTQLIVHKLMPIPVPASRLFHIVIGLRQFSHPVLKFGIDSRRIPH